MTRDAYGRLEDERGRLLHARVAHGDALRTARQFGEPAGNDELMAVREEAAITEARLARVEAIIARAAVVEDGRGSGFVSIGSAVTVLDHQSGRTATYIVDGAHGSLDANVISALSPMGVALLGRGRGDVVSVDLPRDRIRNLTVLDVAAAEST